jgi:hypothetical protein
MKESLIKEVKARTNLDETAFFFPNLYTDAEGNIKLEFTSPEALTNGNLFCLPTPKILKQVLQNFLPEPRRS